MDSAAIASLVKYFNIASITALALFAAFGAVAVFVKKLRGKPFLFAFCAAALAAFALESTAFNLPRYLKYFAGPPTAVTGVSETDPNILMTSDGTRAEVIGGNGVRFNSLNRKVTSIFVDVNFHSVEKMEIAVIWTDRGGTYQYNKNIYKYLPHENYAPLQPCGEVSDITVLFSDNADINTVEINKPVPFYFSGLRLLVVSFLFFAFFALINKNLRAKAAYYFFEYKFDPKNKRQDIVYACTVALLILFSGICVYTSVPENFITQNTSQYGKYLVDALIAGRTYLDYGNPEKLLAAERPYDNQWRGANGYDEVFDWAWYKGKYYCYFGVVPAALLFVPYKMITGNYLPDYTGVLLFGAFAVILLALLWRHCAKKYMRDIRYALYLLSLPTLFFASCVTLALRFPHVYSVVQCAGFMFAVAGVLLLLKSVDFERINYPKLFFACLCLALVFGCRPNMGLASLLVPVVLWKKRSWKLCVFALLPYMLVAIPLCAYNYVRFGSIFDFGATYSLTYFDMTAYAQQNILGKVFRIFVCSAYYLFCPNRFYLTFPFVNLMTAQPVEHVSLGIMWFYNNVCGLINFPIVFCLFYLFKNIFDKNKPNTFCALSASLIIAAVIMVLNSIIAGVSARYGFDFAALVIFPSLFCAYYWCQNHSGNNVAEGCSPGLKNRLSLTYALIAVSIFVGLFVSVRTIFSYYDHTLYRYIECSLGILRDV
jgi:hypothetical protein